MSKTLKRAAFTFGILALAGAIFVAGGFAGRSLAGDSEETDKASYQKGKEAAMIDAAEALQVLMPAFELRDAGPIVPVPDADLCEAVLELVDLYEPLRPWYARSDSYHGTMGAYMDPAPKEIWDADVRYCE